MKDLGHVRPDGAVGIAGRAGAGSRGSGSSPDSSSGLSQTGDDLRDVLLALATSAVCVLVAVASMRRTLC